VRVRKHVGQSRYRIEGFGYTFQRGRWWWIRYWQRGTEHREPAHSRDEKAAYRLLKRRHGEIAGQTFVGPREERVRFEDLKRVLTEKYELQARRSLSTAQLRLRYLEGFFAQDRAIDLTTARLQAYQAHRRQEEASAATVNRELSVLHRAFVIAARAGLLSRVPMFPERLEESAPREETLEPAEHLAIREHLPPDYQDALDFALETGWRKKAIFTLPWPAVDLQGGTVRLAAEFAKNKGAQLLPISPPLRAVLARRAAARRLDCPLVFHVAGRPMYHGWQKAWDAARTAAGLLGKRLHDARRTVARDLARSGVAPTTAMRITGHKSPVMYRRYAVVRDADLQDAADRLAAYRASLPAPERKVIPISAAQGNAS
jgi:integrase